MKIGRVLDHKARTLTFYEYHLNNTVLKELRHNRITMYDIKLSDLLKQPHTEKVLAVAEAEQYPVLLVIKGVTRLFKFDRKYDTHEINHIGSD